MGKALEAALAKAKKDFGLRIAPLNDFSIDVEGISTGNIAIDHITGVGGLPKGRIVELYGPPSSGKSTTAIQAAAEAQQKLGLIVAYMDGEQAIDPVYCKALGLDINDSSFLLAQPDTAEQCFNGVRVLAASGEVGIIIVDSIGALSIEKELKVDTGKSTFADKAKIMAQAMRQVTPILAESGTILICLNHIQDVIDSSPMGQKLSAQGIKRTTTPGGKALKFHASVRIEYKPIGGIRTAVDDLLTNEKRDVVTSQKVQVTVVKNKVGPPFRTCECRVRFGKGFSQAYSVFQVLVAHDAIERVGKTGVYRFDEITQPTSGKLQIVGEENVIQELESDPEWLEMMTLLAKDYITRTIEQAGATLPTAPMVDDETVESLLKGDSLDAEVRTDSDDDEDPEKAPEAAPDSGEQITEDEAEALLT